MRRAAFIVAAAGAALLAQSAMAQGTITSGTQVYTRTAYPTTAGGLATSINQAGADMRLAGAAGTDQAFDFEWWYRFSTDSRERTLVSPTGTAGWGTNNSTNNFTLSGATGVTAVVTYNLGTDVDGAAGNYYGFGSTLSITNNGAAPVVMSLFSYYDPFINGADAGDNATLQSPDTLRFFDAGGGPTLYYRGLGAQNYMVAAWGSTTGAGSVADSALTTYNNTITGVPGDVAAGWQWTNITIGVGQTVHTVAAISTDPNYVPPAIPAPGSIALVGFAGLAGLRRRR